MLRLAAQLGLSKFRWNNYPKQITNNFRDNMYPYNQQVNSEYDTPNDTVPVGKMWIWIRTP